MIVKLNKGPLHRKVYKVDSTLGGGGYIRLLGPSTRDFYSSSESTDAVLTPREVLTYKMKFVTVEIFGKMETLPCIFPDGSVCFEYAP